MPVLVDHHDGPVVVQRQDDHRPGVLDDLALGLVPTGHDHLIQPQGEDLADVQGVASAHHELVRAAHRSVAGISTGNQSAAR
jgi:hypothetical protein